MKEENWKAIALLAIKRGYLTEPLPVTRRKIRTCAQIMQALERKNAGMRRLRAWRKIHGPGTYPPKISVHGNYKKIRPMFQSDL